MSDNDTLVILKETWPSWLRKLQAEDVPFGKEGESSALDAPVQTGTPAGPPAPSQTTTGRTLEEIGEDADGVIRVGDILPNNPDLPPRIPIF